MKKRYKLNLKNSEWDDLFYSDSHPVGQTETNTSTKQITTSHFFFTKALKSVMNCMNLKVLMDNYEYRSSELSTLGFAMDSLVVSCIDGRRHPRPPGIAATEVKKYMSFLNLQPRLLGFLCRHPVCGVQIS